MSKLSVLCSVVSYRNSTSNHNKLDTPLSITELYLIEILHQTTTHVCVLARKQPLYLIEILHQTTTRVETFRLMFGCILSKFYIKPQQTRYTAKYYRVVSYRNSTSNHNSCLCISEETAVVSYRNSTSNHNCVHALWNWPRVVSYRNSTSNHNAAADCSKSRIVVSYRNSTSNHNVGPHID